MRNSRNSGIVLHRVTDGGSGRIFIFFFSSQLFIDKSRIVWRYRERENKPRLVELVNPKPDYLMGGHRFILKDFSVKDKEIILFLLSLILTRSLSNYTQFNLKEIWSEYFDLVKQFSLV